ncbi:MAG: hypothetical protein IH945_00130 [Armatimonadetes bacterium]|nr:hypothetical protein [Armatimonadota bacterium]
MGFYKALKIAFYIFFGAVSLYMGPAMVIMVVSNVLEGEFNEPAAIPAVVSFGGGGVAITVLGIIFIRRALGLLRN